jgi:phosphatidylglycerol:prolipoprotein diacylglycerol transferase
MFPIICKIGPVTIYAYGLMFAVAVTLCTFLLSRDAGKIGIKQDVVFDLAFWVIAAGILGARLFYILLHLEFFAGNLLEMIMLQNGGLAWQGGLIFACAAGVMFLKKKGLSLGVMLDLAAPYAALGQSIGRVGCFFNGCCYGREVPWGIFFPVHQAHMHPTQLYLSFGLLILFFILRIYQKTSHRVGSVFTFYLFLDALLRFVVEFFRADHDVFVFGLSIYQGVCLGLMVWAVYVHTRLKS